MQERKQEDSGALKNDDSGTLVVHMDNDPIKDDPIELDSFDRTDDLDADSNVSSFATSRLRGQGTFKERSVTVIDTSIPKKAAAKGKQAGLLRNAAGHASPLRILSPIDLPVASPSLSSNGRGLNPSPILDVCVTAATGESFPSYGVEITCIDFIDVGGGRDTISQSANTSSVPGCVQFQVSAEVVDVRCYTTDYTIPQRFIGFISDVEEDWNTMNQLSFELDPTPKLDVLNVCVTTTSGETSQSEGVTITVNEYFTTGIIRDAIVRQGNTPGVPGCVEFPLSDVDGVIDLQVFIEDTVFPKRFTDFNTDLQEDWDVTKILSFDLNRDRVAQEDPHPSQPNGCSSTFFEIIITGSVDNDAIDFFEASCNNHDLCWANCTANRRDCNAEFLQNMQSSCNVLPYGSNANVNCKEDALKLYGRAVDLFFGVFSYLTTRKKSGCADADVSQCPTSYESDIARGVELQAEGDTYPDVCQRLPLLDDDCYQTEDPDYVLSESIVVSLLPFTKVIIDGINWVENELAKLEEQIEPALDFFKAEEEETGSCVVVNEEMFGFAENPGIPSPYIYDICNCLSILLYGVQQCTTQVYFQGVAVAVENDALRYDIDDQLDGDGNALFYDGFAHYSFAPSGDLWASMSLSFSLPKLFGIPFSADKIQNFVCTPKFATPGGESTKSNFGGSDLKAIDIRGSMFFKTPSEDDQETLAILAIEEIRMQLSKKPFSFLRFSVGGAIGALRENTADPVCQPGGIFAKIELGTDFGLGEDLRKLLNIPNLTASADFGVIWNDLADDPQDVMQAIFLRVEWDRIDMMGISVRATTVEMQYIDDLEFGRRREWVANQDRCCSLDNVDTTDGKFCGFDEESRINNFVLSLAVNPQPTFILVFEIDEIQFAYGVVLWKDILVEAILQLPEDLGDSLSVRFQFAITIDVLFILELQIFAKIFSAIEPTTGESIFSAEFAAAAEINIGVGIVTSTVYAAADVTYFTYSVEDDDDGDSDGENRQLQTLGGSSFEGADWELVVELGFKNADFLGDLRESLYQELLDVYNALKVVWDVIDEYVIAAWNEVKRLAIVIGGAVEDLINQAKNAINSGVGDVSDVLNDLGNIFSGKNPTGPLAGFGNVLLEGAKTVVKLGEAIFSGDFESAGEILAAVFDNKSVQKAFGFGGKNRNREPARYDPERFDDLFGCPLVFDTWEKCQTAFGAVIPGTCRPKRGADYVEQSCLLEKTNQLAELETITLEGDEAAQCRIASESRNQGIKWLGEDASAKDQLNPTMSDTNTNLGKTSEFADTGTCQTVDLEVGVNKLATQSAGISGRGTSQLQSSSCVNFATEADLAIGLVDLKKEATDTMTDISRGNQGIDKDDAVKNCGDIAGLQCITPKIEEGDAAAGFKIEATTTCDVAVGSLNLKEIFGEPTLTISEICPEARVGFRLLGSQTDASDVCAPNILTYERYAVDCCNQRTPANSLTHRLIVEAATPVFTTEPGTIDMQVTCDANVFPDASGILSPEYEAGCSDSSTEPSIDDSDPVFDPETCQTTFTRTWTVTQDGCESNSATFEQAFILKNDYDPEWDFFPEDVTIEVFGAYGPEATGFPTVFQKCGASPIQVTYEDEIVPGSCFAERILTRTFTATDICGHQIVRSQTIKIANGAEALPLGSKSLAFVYGAHESRVDQISDVCLHGSDACGITGAPEYECGTSDDTEFDSYEEFLLSLDTERSLDKGATEKSFACPDMDPTCDTRTMHSLQDMVVYRTQQVDAAESSHGTIVSVRPDRVNNGVASTPQEVSCEELNVRNRRLKTKNGNSGNKGVGNSGNKNGNGSNGNNGNGNNKDAICTETILSGTNAVYNMFLVQAMDFATTTFVIDVPETSIALINVLSDPEEDFVDIDKDLTVGIRLEGGFSAHNVLWNIPEGVRWRINSRNRPFYSFYGTLLNRGGDMQILFSNYDENLWTGQIFSNTTNINKASLQCGGHFAGFASCDRVN